MAYQIIKNVSIAGITTCVPKNVEENTSLPFFKEGEAEKVILSCQGSEDELLLSCSLLTLRFLRYFI